MLNEGNQTHIFISSSGSGTVINYGSGSDFLASYGSGSTSQKVTVPTVPVPVLQHCRKRRNKTMLDVQLFRYYAGGTFCCSHSEDAGGPGGEYP